MLRKFRSEASSRIKGTSHHGEDEELQVYSPDKDEPKGGLFDDTPEHSPKQKLKDSDRELFESQLMLLQDQLTSSYVTNQDLSDELSDVQKDRAELKQQLSAEQRKREELEKSVETLTARTQTLTETKQEETDGDQGTKLLQEEFMKLQEKLTTATIERQEFETKLMKVNEERALAEKGRKRPLKEAVTKFYDKVLEAILSKIYEVVDLMEVTPEGTTTAEEPSLHLSTLRDNLKRFFRNLRFIRNFFDWVNGILTWKRPFETLMIFVLLIGSIWTGWFFQLVLVVVLGKLTYNYLCVAGLSDRFGIFLSSTPDQEPEPTSNSALSTVNLVKELAQKIQVSVVHSQLMSTVYA
jgi:hypothetical protein